MRKIFWWNFSYSPDMVTEPVELQDNFKNLCRKKVQKKKKKTIPPFWPFLIYSLDPFAKRLYGYKTTTSLADSSASLETLHSINPK